MSYNEQRIATPEAADATFVPRSQVMTPDDIGRAGKRIAHEIVERNQGGADVVLVGLQSGGVELANLLGEVIEAIEGTAPPIGILDIAQYRDDHEIRPISAGRETNIPVDLTDKVLVIVDDVLFTGRTVRAALNALGEFGRARTTQLAVMVDRGHRELPIRPDFVGKNLPTRITEEVVVDFGTGVMIGETQQ